MRYPDAIWLPGPPAKVYSSTPTHQKTGVCLHEAEYDVTQDEQVLYNALFSDRQASWPFTITREGFLFQHYDLDATCWHCSWPGNLWLVGIELEITRNRKLTEPQYQVLVRLLKWLAWELDWDGWAWNIGHYGQPHKDAILWEHNQAQKPYTDCQVFSQGVVDPIKLIADLEEKEMVEDQFAMLRDLEIGFMRGAEIAHAETVRVQFGTISHIRHNEGESTEEEMERWKRLGRAYTAEIGAIRKALERCSWLGRPG